MRWAWNSPAVMGSGTTSPGASSSAGGVSTTSGRGWQKNGIEYRSVDRVVGVHDPVGRGRHPTVEVPAELVAAVDDELALVAVDPAPAAVAIAQLQAVVGGGGEQGDEVDVLVGGGAHRAGRRVRADRRVVQHPQDRVGAHHQVGQVAAGEAEVLGDRLEQQLRGRLHRGVEARSSPPRTPGTSAGQTFAGARLRAGPTCQNSLRSATVASLAFSRPNGTRPRAPSSSGRT